MSIEQRCFIFRDFEFNIDEYISKMTKDTISLKLPFEIKVEDINRTNFNLHPVQEIELMLNNIIQVRNEAIEEKKSIHQTEEKISNCLPKNEDVNMELSSDPVHEIQLMLNDIIVERNEAIMANQEYQTVSQRFQQLKQDMEELNGKYNDKHTALMGEKEETARILKLNEDLKNQIVVLKKELQEKEQDRRNLTNEVDQLKQTNFTNEGIIDCLTNENDILKNDLEIFEQNTEDAKKTLHKKHQDKINELVEKNREREERLRSSLQHSLQRYNDIIREFEHAYNELAEKNRELALAEEFIIDMSNRLAAMDQTFGQFSEKQQKVQFDRGDQNKVMQKPNLVRRINYCSAKTKNLYRGKIVNKGRSLFSVSDNGCYYNRLSQELAQYKLSRSISVPVTSDGKLYGTRKLEGSNFMVHGRNIEMIQKKQRLVQKCSIQ